MAESSRGRTLAESRATVAAVTAMGISEKETDEIYEQWADSYDEVSLIADKDQGKVTVLMD